MSDIILVTGGARSGKSSFALTYDAFSGRGAAKKAFIATGVATDDEMCERIKKHREERGDGFDTFEVEGRLAEKLSELVIAYDFIIIDCVTFLINNLIYKGMTDDEIYLEFDQVIAALEKGNSAAVFVTNEVGLGIVPGTELARRFRDLVGRVNQMLAKAGKEVYHIVAGIPQRLK